MRLVMYTLRGRWLHQLHLDEKKLKRNTLEKQTNGMKRLGREEKIRKIKLDDDEYFMQIWVVMRIDSDLRARGKTWNQVVAIVKSCSPNALGDLNVTMKDLSGTVPITIHYKVLDVGSYENDITVGVAMILVNVLDFTPKPSKHYLNITKRNVVEVFRKDTISLA
ncbi:transposase, MuDR, MULE transposase domain protein [Tanacetum coccineum]|uniref:Transposase, MuDR, MULE transposase domain protein n=1 Tax=Tanacetum coccineum TaxID=301880 RepID=A0ABQ5CFT2_9ASTR